MMSLLVDPSTIVGNLAIALVQARHFLEVVIEVAWDVRLVKDKDESEK